MSKIMDYLLSLEPILDIDILYACECGSKAYGYNTLTSDSDVRVIFKRKQDKYLSIKQPKDSFEIKFENMDIVCWDIHKFFKQVYKGNAQTFEWIHSDIIYLQKNYCIKNIKKAGPHETKGQLFKKSNLIINYYYWATNSFKIFAHQNEEKHIKNYCSIARVLLMMIYIDTTELFPTSLNVFFIMQELEKENVTNQYGIPFELLKELFICRSTLTKMTKYNLKDLDIWFVAILDIFKEKKDIEKISQLEYAALEKDLNKILKLEIINNEEIPWKEKTITEDVSQTNIIS